MAVMQPHLFFSESWQSGLLRSVANRLGATTPHKFESCTLRNDTTPLKHTMMKQDAVLSNRETQVAELLAWGAAKKEVSDMLTISTRTVENITRNVYVKIGIQKATELCVWWFTTKCGVSMNLSPFKRKMGALMLLLIMTHTVFGQQGSDMARCRTVRTCRTVRAARGRRAEGDTDIAFINL